MGELRLEVLGEETNGKLGNITAENEAITPGKTLCKPSVQRLDKDSSSKDVPSKGAPPIGVVGENDSDSAPQSSGLLTLPMEGETQARKATHLKVCMEDDVQCQSLTTGLERYRFRHCCLPELGFDDLDCTVNFLGGALKVPLLISSMTGGTDLAWEINRRLARAAQAYGLAMGVGSQRVSVECPETAQTFAVRSLAPSAVLLA